jgi:hypothetical protein
MTQPDQNWGTIHPSVYHDTAGPVRAAVATARPHGAVRYRCPITGSFILVTDEPTLRRLARPRVRLRCAGCGEMHLMLHDDGDDGDDPGLIVAQPAKP